jgi:heme A synthase
LVGVHIAVGLCLIALNLAAGLVGGIAWFRKSASVSFWYLLRAAQVSVFLQALLGGLLVVTGHEPKEQLHYLYGILPLFVSFIAEGARFGAAERELGDVDPESISEAERETFVHAILRREMGIMSVSCWVIFFLALRAATTSGL